jgi:hypothetical protein
MTQAARLPGMNKPLRKCVLLLAAGLAASVARAEGVGSAPASASTDRRLYSATTLVPYSGGLLSIGGAPLRRLAPGSRTWETLLSLPKDNLYRVAGDDSGRVLATWEDDPSIYLFQPGQKQPLSFPKPPSPPDLERRSQVTDLEFMPDGRGILVFMSGTVRVTTGSNRGDSWSTAAYRIPLDGKYEAQLLFRVDHGYRLHTSVHGAVFAMNAYPGRKCDHGECLAAAIVAYELTGNGVVQKLLVDGKQLRVNRVRVVRGSNNEHVAVMLDLWPKSLGLMSWRYGDAQAGFRTVPWPENEDKAMFFLNKAGEFLELRPRERHLEVWRLSPEGDTQLASLKALQFIDTGLHAMGERGDGTLWVHWGDHIGLLAPGKAPRGYNLEPLLPTKRSEWAGADIYIQEHEHLWVGIDGKGRHYERVDFSDMEKRSKPWPSAAR